MAQAVGPAVGRFSRWNSQGDIDADDIVDIAGDVRCTELKIRIGGNRPRCTGVGDAPNRSSGGIGTTGGPGRWQVRWTTACSQGEHQYCISGSQATVIIDIASFQAGDAIRGTCKKVYEQCHGIRNGKVCAAVGIAISADEVCILTATEVPRAEDQQQDRCQDEMLHAVPFDVESRCREIQKPSDLPPLRQM